MRLAFFSSLKLEALVFSVSRCSSLLALGLGASGDQHNTETKVGVVGDGTRAGLGFARGEFGGLMLTQGAFVLKHAASKGFLHYFKHGWR